MCIAKILKAVGFCLITLLPVQVGAQFLTPENKVLNHLELGVNAGSTGIGIEVASPIGNYLRLRTGVDYMPQFKYNMNFGIQLGDDPVGKYDPEGNLTHFGKLSEMLMDMTGYEPDDHATLEGTPTFTNFKFLVDILPFKNKHWRFTVGLYAGGQRVAKAENVISDAPTLLAVDIYNNIYDKVENEEEIIMGMEFPPDVCEKILSYGKMAMVLGNYKHDILDAEGNVTHKKGDPYKMFPDNKSMVRAHVKTNKVRPYIGFGYGGTLRKMRKLNCSLDCGVMYIGDAKVYTHDGTCLSTDITNYCNSIKNYMKLFNKVKVYPVLNFRISYRIF